MFNVTTSRPSRRKLSGAKAAGVRRIVIPGLADWATRGATPGGHTISSWGAERPYFTGLSRSHFKVAEGEGF